MEITIKGSPKEIADLVTRLQDQLSQEVQAPISVSGQELCKVTCRLGTSHSAH